MQLELCLQLIFHLDDQVKASKIYILSKLNHISCCLAKSKQPKEIFKRNILFTSVAMKNAFYFPSISRSLCLIPYPSGKDASLLLGFHSTCIISSVMDIFTSENRREHGPFSDPEIKSYNVIPSYR